MDILNSTLTELKSALENKSLSSRELVNFYLGRIEKYDPKLKAFLHVASDQAKKQAKEYDDKRAKGETLPPCAGIPVALKDLIVTSDMPTTCASKMLEGFMSPFDATIVANMKKAGYIVMGKLNMDQFAMGSSGETSYFQKTVNPWDHTRVPGGSSSGSAAAVAAKLVPVAIGSDTGGSIRQPAGFCGVTGLKPTYGRVSRFGAVSYASSLDQLGPLCSSVEDVAFVMDTLGLHDPMDSTSMPDKTDFHATLMKTGDSLKGMKLGLPINHLTEDVAEDVRNAVMGAVNTCKDLGAEIVDVEMPLADKGLPAYQMIANAEAASNLAKYDGIEFGYRAHSNDLNEVYCASRGTAFGPEVKKRVILGTYILLEGQYEEYYKRAMKIRRLLRRDYDNAFNKCDLIIGPTSSTTAFTFGAKRTAMEMYLNDLFTVVLNLNGSCGITIPCGFDKNGLPVGFQLQGDMLAEDKLLKAAHIFQKATNWHRHIPKGYK